MRRLFCKSFTSRVQCLGYPLLRAYMGFFDTVTATPSKTSSVSSATNTAVAEPTNKTTPPSGFFASVELDLPPANQAVDMATEEKNTTPSLAVAESVSLDTVGDISFEDDTNTSTEASLAAEAEVSAIEEDVSSPTQETTESIDVVSPTKTETPVFESLVDSYTASTVSAVQNTPVVQSSVSANTSTNIQGVLSQTVADLKTLGAAKTQERNSLLAQIEDINQEIARRKKEATELTKTVKAVGVEEERIAKTIAVIEAQMAA